MIRATSVEKSLHRWQPWLNAVENARRIIKLDTTNNELYWSYGRAILCSLRLPAKPQLCRYFLSCVLSEYERNGIYYYNELKQVSLPYSTLRYFEESLRLLMARQTIDQYMGAKTIRQWPDLGLLLERPLPPAIWNKKDVHFVINALKHNPGPDMSVYETIRRFCGPYFMVLSSHHPLHLIGSKIKREYDKDIAWTSAEMKDDNYKYEQIADKFGFPKQEDSYGRKIRSSTARDYVRRGRMLRNH